MSTRATPAATTGATSFTSTRELVHQDDGSAAARCPPVAAQVAACGPCEQDLEGLLDLLTEQE